MKGLIDKIRAALGDDHAKLADELATAAEAALSEADAAAAAKRDAEKAQKIAEAKVAKLTKDLEAKASGESEELAKLRTERDKLAADLDGAKGEAGKVRLDYALRDAAREAGMRDVDALKMLDTSGVSLDDGGKLVGADAVFKAAKAAKPYLFEGGQGAGVQPGTGAPPKPGDGKGGAPPPADKNTLIVQRTLKLAGVGANAPVNGGWGPPPAPAPGQGGGAST